MTGSVRVALRAERDRCTKLAEVLSTQVHDLTFVSVLARHHIAADRWCRTVPLPTRLLGAYSSKDGLSAPIILAAKDVAPLCLNHQASIECVTTPGRNQFTGRADVNHHSPQPMNL